ncbi:MAG TPA: AMP-binding protein [Acidimicrobiia bacterium]|nr:AMP-binding protein [Acidimicrobiia bacterium]
MPDILAIHADAQPETPAVIVDSSGGARPSATDFRAFNALVNRAAHAFVAVGAEPRDRMVWCGPNSLEVLATVHAARKASLTAVPLSYRFNAEEMAYVIDNSDATLVVVDAEQAPLLAEVSHRLTKVRAFVVFGGDVPPGFRSWDETLAGQPDTEPTIAAPETAGASMIYTSGTTGRPKGALRTRTDAKTVFALLSELNLQPGNEVHVTTGPLYHSGPLAWASMNHSLGCPVVVLRKFDPQAWLRLVAEHRVTNTFSAPTQLKRIVSLPPGELARADLSSMRSLVADAAPVPYALKQEVIEKLGDGFLYEVYGSTELGVVTVLHPEDQLRKPGSCGLPAPGVELKLVDEAGQDIADPHVPGELYVRSASVFSTYYKAQDKYEEDRRGEFHTVGDIAYRDEEGYYYICDRKKDMIISGGMNIYPAEIEAALEQHPDIFDVAVFGVPSEEWGESVHAVVVPADGRTLTEQDVIAFARQHLAGYKVPRSVTFADELPRTGSGKILKRELRAPFWAGHDSQVG